MLSIFMPINFLRQLTLLIQIQLCIDERTSRILAARSQTGQEWTLGGQDQWLAER